MTAPEATTLDARVAALEAALASAHADLRQLRGASDARRAASRASRLGVGMLVLVVGLGAAQAPTDSTPLTVRAPFTVVDAAGRPLLEVADDEGGTDRGLLVYSAQGTPIDRLGTFGGYSGLQVDDYGGTRIGTFGEWRGAVRNDDSYRGLVVFNSAGDNVAAVDVNQFTEGGYVAALSPDGSSQAQLNTRADGSAGFFYWNDGKLRAHLGRMPKGNVILRVKGADGMKTVAAMGESVDGGGGAAVLNSASGEDRVVLAAPADGGQVKVFAQSGGKAAAALSTEGGRGVVSVGTGTGALAAKLTESEQHAGAGHLLIAAPDGSAAVEAGFSGRCGVVRAIGEGRFNYVSCNQRLPGTF